jgi:hypothetical protein
VVAEHLVYRECLDDDPQRAQDREATQGRAVEHVAHDVLELLDLDDRISLADADLGGEAADASSSRAGVAAMVGARVIPLAG